MNRIAHLLFAALIPFAVQADEYSTLNGFQLWQFRDVVKSELSAPDEIIDTEKSTVEIHFIGKEGYMVFEYIKDMPHNIYSLQITGSVPSMMPFQGLKLGDSDAKVRKTLGEPARIIQVESPKVCAYYYYDTNVSVEVDEEQKLYSIRIGISNNMMSKISSEDSPYLIFVEALKSKNVYKLMDTMRPDVEIYRGGKILYINKKLSNFRQQPDKEFMDALTGPSNSVLSEVDVVTPESEIRIKKKMGIGRVYKFYQSKLLKEIVFFPYDGKYRVYEITFR